MLLNMDLTLGIYLICGLNYCLAASLQPRNTTNNNLSVCINSTTITKNHEDIFKNCKDFKDLQNITSLNYKNTTRTNALCFLYYKNLINYCQLNNTVISPKLDDIELERIEVICKELTPILNITLQLSSTVSCYALCAEESGSIRPECVFAHYYTKSHQTDTKKENNNDAAQQRVAIQKELPIENSVANMNGIPIEVVNNHIETNPNREGVGDSEKQFEDADAKVKNPIVDSNSGVNQQVNAELPVGPKANDKVEDNSKAAKTLTTIKKDANQPINNVEAISADGQTDTKDNKKANNEDTVDTMVNNKPQINNKPLEDQQDQIDPDILDNSNHDGNNQDMENYLDDDTKLEAPVNEENVPQQQKVVDNIDNANTVKKENIKEDVDHALEKKPIVPETSVNSDNIEDLDGESYFFSYFMVICVLFILGYVGYHNRIKVMALLLEGKRGKRQQRGGRRPNSANYHKLDSNLEEAISSNVNKNANNVIY